MPERHRRQRVGDVVQGVAEQRDRARTARRRPLAESRWRPARPARSTARGCPSRDVSIAWSTLSAESCECGVTRCLSRCHQLSRPCSWSCSSWSCSSWSCWSWSCDRRGHGRGGGRRSRLHLPTNPAASAVQAAAEVFQAAVHLERDHRAAGTEFGCDLRGGGEVRAGRWAGEHCPEYSRPSAPSRTLPPPGSRSPGRSRRRAAAAAGGRCHRLRCDAYPGHRRRGPPTRPVPPPRGACHCRARGSRRGSSRRCRRSSRTRRSSRESVPATPRRACGSRRPCRCC